MFDKYRIKWYYTNYNITLLLFITILLIITSSILRRPVNSNITRRAFYAKRKDYCQAAGNIRIY